MIIEEIIVGIFRVGCVDVGSVDGRKELLVGNGNGNRQLPLNGDVDGLPLIVSLLVRGR